MVLRRSQQFQNIESRDLSGQSTGISPPFSASLTATFIQPLQRSSNFVAEVSPYFSSRYDVMDDPPQHQASYIRLDGRLGIESPNKHWALELIDKNLTDRQIIQIIAGTSLAPGTRYVTVDETDSANGFANRFLMMCVKRSKMLPFGGAPLPLETLTTLVVRIRTATERARHVRAVTMTDAARQVWERIYPRLGEGYAGLLGAVTARAEAQCIRLALAYALADQSREIDAHHLLAAIAVWERCEASARYVFGGALGDRFADDLLRSLRAAGTAGLTRTEINALFRGNESADRIGAALRLLHDRRLAISRQIIKPGPGRPTEIWCATNHEINGLNEIKGTS